MKYGKLCLLVSFALIGAVSAGAQDAILHNFGASQSDGTLPYSGVTEDAQGNLYGTTDFGGLYGCGTVWELTPAGTYLDRHDFNYDGQVFFDGAHPSCSVTIDPSGDLFGTTSNGGVNNVGTVWEINAAGLYEKLHDFNIVDGQFPYAGVSLDSNGNLYGTAVYGGYFDYGLVWKLDTLGNIYDLHDFGGAPYDGASPYGGVTLDSQGNMYGTAYGGGANQEGMIWELPAPGGYRDIHDFSYDGYSSFDGAYPQAGVTVAPDGAIYGTTYLGGYWGGGSLWEIEGNIYSPIYDFGYPYDGSFPESPVTVDAANNVYGSTYLGGAYGNGMIWELTYNGYYNDLHDFLTGSSDGANPLGNLAVDASGNVFGTCYSQGAEYEGAVWALGPSFSSITSLTPNSRAVNGTHFELDVIGTGFNGGCGVIFNGHPVQVTDVTSNDIRAEIPSAYIATDGEYPVSVSFPYGYSTPPLYFTVFTPNPVPTVTSVTPSSLTAGGNSFTLQVFGSGFLSSSTVKWGGLGRPTTYVSQYEVDAVISASDIAKAASRAVFVTNPKPGGGDSNSVMVTVLR